MPDNPSTGFMELSYGVLGCLLIAFLGILNFSAFVAFFELFANLEHFPSSSLIGLCWNVVLRTGLVWLISGAIMADFWFCKAVLSDAGGKPSYRPPQEDS